MESARCIISADRCAVISSTMLVTGFTFELSSIPCFTVESVAGVSLLGGAE